MFCVYILLPGNKQLYTGYTKDLKRRVVENKRGEAGFTFKRKRIKLIHYETYLLEGDASI
ncbi:GIY-YIG nuclease family protein [Patescibacteria group bacterium]|nr:GIY-YIG nuclease family protein [Patescibacteria group bacterium]